MGLAWFALGAFVGAPLGFFLAALMASAAQADRHAALLMRRQRRAELRRKSQR